MAENYERKIYDAIQKGYITDPNEQLGGTGQGAYGESLFPPPSKPQGKKQTGATGATGAKGPSTDSSNPAAQGQALLDQRRAQNNALANSVGNRGVTDTTSNVFSDSPAAQNLRQQHLNTTGDTRADQIAGQAGVIQNHFESPPTMTHYHWYAGSGGVQGGNDAGMRVDYSDGTSNWVPTNKPGEFPSAAPTTRMNQNEMLGRVVNSGQGGGGILPAWNSPTGQNIDLTAFGPKEVDISAAGPASPKGWLNSAIAAARSGANTYDTGGTRAEGNFPQGGIETRKGRDYADTPSGGTVGLHTGSNRVDNPFIGERANLVNAVNQSQPKKPADEYQGGY